MPKYSAKVERDERSAVNEGRQSLSIPGFGRVIYALGGTTPANLLRMLGIEFNDEGPIIDPSGETNVPGLFLIGDLVVGRTGGSIILAFNSATRGMRRICEGYLVCSRF